VLGSHDGDFSPQVPDLPADGRRVRYSGKPSSAMAARACNQMLPRVRILDLEQLDPLALP